MLLLHLSMSRLKKESSYRHLVIVTLLFNKALKHLNKSSSTERVIPPLCL
jgi:hypothetical protein